MQFQQKRILTWFDRTANIWAALLVLIFLFTGVLTLRYYGLTWDESLGNLFFGERYFQFFSSFNPKFLDFDMNLAIHSQHPLNLYLSPFRNTPNEFPPLADTLSAATMYLFSYTLGWLNPIDGFHLFTILLAAVFLWVTYRFFAPRIGKFTALLAIIFLGTFPRFWADMHFNVKDVPETLFFGLTLMTYWSWYEKPRWTKALLAGVLMGCALAVKANAIFIPVLLLLAVLPWNFRKAAWLDLIRHFARTFWQYGIMMVSALGAYILSWPYLYADPYHRLKQYWGYIFSQGGRSGGFAWNIDPIRQVVTTLPEFFLAAVLVGLVVVVLSAVKSGKVGWRILILWLIFPILRASLPGMVNFDGIRHFLEFVPAAAVIAAIGFTFVLHWLEEHLHLRREVVDGVAVGLVLINLVWIYTAYFPNLHLYYNSLVGGLSGARDGFLGADATDYWGTTYRAGMEWINQNAPENSSVQALIAPWIVDISAPVILRPDIEVIPQGTLSDYSILREKRTPTYLMFITRGVAQNSNTNYCVTHEKPVHQIFVDGVPVLMIFQFGG